jgi:flagellin FlaB
VTTDSGPSGVDKINTTVQLGPGSTSVDLNQSTVSIFTDNGTSTEFDGVISGTGGSPGAITLESNLDDTSIKTNTVLSTDSSSDNATATIVFDISATGSTNGGEFSVSEFESGTRVNIVITTPSGTQAQTSFIVEDPLDPQLEEGDEIRLG